MTILSLDEGLRSYHDPFADPNVTYRDIKAGDRRVVVEIVDPSVRTRAAKLSLGSVVAAAFASSAGVVAPAVAALGVVAASGACAAALWLERRFVERTVVVLDEASRQVRVERTKTDGRTAIVALVPLDAELRFVSRGTIVDRKRVEVVELRRGDETIAELVRKPDGMVASFAFAHVDPALRRLNEAVAELTRAQDDAR